MTINKRLSRANGIASNENNVTRGKLISIEVVISTDFVDQKTGEAIEVEQIEWVWQVETRLGKPTHLHAWSGLNVNSEKSWYDGKEWTYNMLTTLLIKTGLVDAENIDDADLEAIDFDSLINREFEFELERRSTKKTIQSIKLSTLKLV